MGHSNHLETRPRIVERGTRNRGIVINSHIIPVSHAATDASHGHSYLSIDFHPGVSRTSMFQNGSFVNSSTDEDSVSKLTFEKWGNLESHSDLMPNLAPTLSDPLRDPRGFGPIPRKQLVSFFNFGFGPGSKRSESLPLSPCICTI